MQTKRYVLVWNFSTNFRCTHCKLLNLHYRNAPVLQIEARGRKKRNAFHETCTCGSGERIVETKHSPENVLCKSRSASETRSRRRCRPLVASLPSWRFQRRRWSCWTSSRPAIHMHISSLLAGSELRRLSLRKRKDGGGVGLSWCISGRQKSTVALVLPNPSDAENGSKPGVPNLGYICLSEGVHLRLGIERKNVLIYYLFPNILTYKSSIKNSVDLLFYSAFLVFVIRNFRGACSSVEIMKGYMVRERLGTLALNQGRRTCGPQKNFVRPAKHSGETSSYYFRLLFVPVDEQFFSFLTGFIVWLKSCAARLHSGNWQSGPR